MASQPPTGPQNPPPDSAAPGRPAMRQRTYVTQSPIELAPGTLLIGTYEIHAHINTGGMGEVYRGVNIHNDEVVAIKIVLPALAHDKKILSLFQKESTVLRRISHDAIVRYEVFTIDPDIARPCLVMEYVEGPSLGDLMELGPMPGPEVLRLLRRLAEGLNVAHRAGVVHRDLSPDNVILPDSSVSLAKIIDFGIAKATTPGGRTLIGGQFAGKPGYVAPEQLGLYNGEVTEQADIYSLGLMAAAAAQGRPIDMGDSPAAAVLARATVPDLSGLEPGLQPLIGWMLAPDPVDRPASMTAIIAYLDSLVPPGDASASQPPVSYPPLSQPPLSQSPVSQPPLGQQPAYSALSQMAAPMLRQATTGPAGPVSTAAATGAAGMDPAVSAAPHANADTSADASSASPFGPAPTASAYTPESPPAQSKGPMLAVVALLLAGLAGGGAWYAGLLGGGSEAGPQAGTNVASGATGGPVGSATGNATGNALPTPAAAPDQPPPLDGVAALAWLEEQTANLPDCTWLARDQDIETLIGYSADPASFSALRAAFAQQFGQPLPLQTVALAPPQCAALNSITALDRMRDPAQAPALVLRDLPTIIGANTTALSGRVDPARPVALFLIDPAGQVQNIAPTMQDGVFEISESRLRRLARPTSGLPDNVELTAMILALDSPAATSVLGLIPENAILPGNQATEFWQFLEQVLDTPDRALAVALSTITLSGS